MHPGHRLRQGSRRAGFEDPELQRGIADERANGDHPVNLYMPTEHREMFIHRLVRRAGSLVGTRLDPMAAVLDLVGHRKGHFVVMTAEGSGLWGVRV
ncbi:hypothetical protein GCM10010439_29280 [Actinocorallia aurantiaca]|uniref:Uncharacterized protein n=2 Tax=Actinocorallia aurantiaca TaxID=46204 RepID=A0ABN3UCA5_9ACTN